MTHHLLPCWLNYWLNLQDAAADGSTVLNPVTTFTAAPWKLCSYFKHPPHTLNAKAHFLSLRPLAAAQTWFLIDSESFSISSAFGE
jgi:hypothetical protein